MTRSPGQKVSTFLVANQKILKCNGTFLFAEPLAASSEVSPGCFDQSERQIAQLVCMISSGRGVSILLDASNEMPFPDLSPKDRPSHGDPPSVSQHFEESTILCRLV